jgi:CHAT domain-containing protein/tetratricopeptide (TPR) repeat protein
VNLAATLFIALLAALGASDTGAQTVRPGTRPAAADAPTPTPAVGATAAADTVAALAIASRGDQALARGDAAAAWALYQDATRQLGSSAEPALRAQLHYRTGRALMAARRAAEAVPALESALALQTPLGNAVFLGQIMSLLAEAMGAGEERERTLALFDAALRQRRVAGDLPGEVRTLINLAQWHIRVGEWGLALQRLNQASQLPITAPNSALNNDDRISLASSRGNVLALLGQYEPAQQAFAEAGALSRAGGDVLGVAESLRNQAFVALERGDPHAAQALNLQSLQGLPNHAHLARALGLNGAGYALVRLHQGAEATPLLEEAVSLLRGEGDEIELARTLESLGSARALLGDVAGARRFYAQGLSLARRHAALDDERELLLSLARLSLQHSEIAAAELYFKLCIDASEQLRKGAARLSAAERQSLAKRLSEPYRLLAQLLMQQRRLLEAERVLLALKDAEYRDYTRGDSGPDNAPVLTPEERALLANVNQTSAELAALYSQLAAAARGATPLSEADKARLARREEDALERLVGALAELDERLKNRHAVALAPALTELGLAERVQVLSRHPQGEPAAMLMFVPDEHLTTALLATAQGSRAVVLPVGLATLTPLVLALREAIINKADYLPAARALHRVLVAQVERELASEALPPKMWMLFLTDELRYLPFAALVDEEGRHLVEKVRLSQLITNALEQLAEPARRWSISAFGSTQAVPARHLGALPAARNEVTSLVRTAANPQGLMAGVGRLDEQFTREAWLQSFQRLNEPAPAATVIHVASHFMALPGDWSNSFLVLGGQEEYRVSELKNAANLSLRHADLVTLSACATELNTQASGRELEGFGTLLLKRGARAVIGTLWAVQDEGTASWMQRFYAARGETRQMSKAAAMQQAQLDLLQGRVRANNPAVDLRHPHYWAPFVLMGNWL